MKFEKTNQLKTIGTAVSLALLLGVGSVNADPPAHSNSPNNNTSEDDVGNNSPKNNPVDENGNPEVDVNGNVVEEYGASIGVSSTCARVDVLGRPNLYGTIFQVTTTITDKSSGDTIAMYGNGQIDYRGKKRRSGKPYPISEGNEFYIAPLGEYTGPLGEYTGLRVNTNTLNLCDALDDNSLEPETVSLNSLIAVKVLNSKDGATYTSKCVATDYYPKVVIDLGTLDSNCTDTDDDGVPDNIDNCPDVANPDQDDLDGNGIGDDCEPMSLSDPVLDPVSVSVPES